eukprot:m.640106 g.640106  ORF g.640106 m.640106 type:complete len:76 (+) comp58337_c0_seq6:61-288(+)
MSEEELSKAMWGGDVSACKRLLTALGPAVITAQTRLGIFLHSAIGCGRHEVLALFLSYAQEIDLNVRDSSVASSI